MSDEMELNLKGKLIPPADTLVVKEKGYPDRHFVRNGENYREVTQCKPRNYEVADSESFIKYLSAFAREYAKGGIVVYNHRSITAFFNEETATDHVFMEWERSLEFKAFLGHEGERSFGQKDLVKALETFPDVVEGGSTLLPNIERLKLETVTEFESNIDERNHVFMYSEKSGKQTAKIPKKLILKLPYFEGSDITTTIEVDVEIRKPKSEDERPVFTLTDPRHQRTFRDALKAEVEHISQELSGWVFIWGEVNR